MKSFICFTDIFIYEQFSCQSNINNIFSTQIVIFYVFCFSTKYFSVNNRHFVIKSSQTKQLYITKNFYLQFSYHRYIKSKSFFKSRLRWHASWIVASVLLISLFILLVWWWLTPFSTIFQLYRGGQFYWWRKPPTCCKSLTNLLHNVLYLALIEIRTHYINGDKHWLQR
jgi:hypothetical protein